MARTDSPSLVTAVARIIAGGDAAIAVELAARIKSFLVLPRMRGISADATANVRPRTSLLASLGGDAERAHLRAADNAARDEA